MDDVSEWRQREAGIDRETRAHSALSEIDLQLGISWAELEGANWPKLREAAERIADYATALIGVCEEAD